ncbi:MAG: class I SAM-dependent methyltransferase [Clostridia bacterium]|nr:class I SAM-dependent methyltransferase [Clostridia bacterium]
MAENSYTVLAHVYDILNGGVDYEALAEAIERCFSEYLPKRPELVLDLACGTGRLTAELARRGYDMIGVDGSVDMLAQAQQNTEGLGVLLLNQNLCEFELYGTVGAVVCSYDSLNYLRSTEELEKCFSLVHNYLDPEGLFLFDMNMPHKFETYYAHNDFILEDRKGDVYCGWQSEYRKRSRTCLFNLSIFEKEATGLYRRRDEQYIEKAYSCSQITGMLTGQGFEVLRCSADRFETEAEDRNTSDRLYFAARCKK